MMSVRRLAAAAAVATLTVVGLGACQSSPAVAAYVGDSEVREKQVDGVVDGLRTTLEAQVQDELDQFADSEQQPSETEVEELRQQRQSELDESLSGVRGDVVQMLLITKAGTDYAQTEELTVPEADPAAVAQQTGLEADEPYVTVAADFVAVTNTLRQAAEPGEVTEADQREVYDNFFQGQPEAPPFEQVQSQLSQDLLGGPVGVRDLFEQVVDQADVRVNPRYDLVYQVQVPLGQQSAWLDVPLGEPSSVVDADRDQ